MPGTFSVPERMPRSCPPPSIDRLEAQLHVAAAHVERADALRARTILCAVIDDADRRQLG